MTRIDYKSRYYDDFQKAKSILSYDKLFEKGYNDDKEYYYTIFDKLKDSNRSTTEVAKEYIKNIQDFFERELYRDNEKQLLVENLLEYLKYYGNEAILQLGRDDDVAHQIIKEKKFKTWGDFSVEVILNNRGRFSDNTDSIITYILELKNELLTFFTSYNSSSFQFSNNFDNVDVEKISSYFIEKLVNTNYLEENELETYLRHAFDLKSGSNKKFNFKNVPTKKKIYEVFYRYYKDIAGKPHGKQKKYASLLGDYFEGYKTSTVSTNFTKFY